jgi:hypothetical protein
MLNRDIVRRWWCEGETDGCLVYTQTPSQLMSLIIVLAACGAFFRFRPYPLFIAVGVPMTVTCLLSFRRAIVLSKDAVLLRPALGKVVAIKLSQIQSVQETQVVTGTTFLARGGVRGIRVLGGTGLLEFPISLRNSEQLVANLQDVVKANAIRNSEAEGRDCPHFGISTTGGTCV